MAAILKSKMGARRTTASNFHVFFFFNLYHYIATIFSSLGSSEVEIKAKISENGGHFEIQDGHQKNNDQLPPTWVYCNP